MATVPERNHQMIIAWVEELSGGVLTATYSDSAAMFGSILTYTVRRADGAPISSDGVGLDEMPITGVAHEAPAFSGLRPLDRRHTTVRSEVVRWVQQFANEYLDAPEADRVWRSTLGWS